MSLEKLTIMTVRHGQTEFNKKKLMSGWSDIDLSPAGIAQLQERKKVTHYPKSDRYVSSALKRTKQTFQILFGEKEELYGSYEGFNEVYFGDIEAEPISEVAEVFYEGFLSENPYKKGETLNQFKSRNLNQLIECCDDLVASGLSSLTIVSHSGTARVLDFIFNNKAIEDYRTPSMPNGLGHIFELEYDTVEKSFKLLNQQAL